MVAEKCSYYIYINGSSQAKPLSCYIVPLFLLVEQQSVKFTTWYPVYSCMCFEVLRLS